MISGLGRLGQSQVHLEWPPKRHRSYLVSLLSCVAWSFLRSILTRTGDYGSVCGSFWLGRVGLWLGGGTTAFSFLRRGKSHFFLLPFFSSSQRAKSPWRLSFLTLFCRDPAGPFFVAVSRPTTSGKCGDGLFMIIVAGDDFHGACRPFLWWTYEFFFLRLKLGIFFVARGRPLPSLLNAERFRLPLPTPPRPSLGSLNGLITSERRFFV